MCSPLLLFCSLPFSSLRHGFSPPECWFEGERVPSCLLRTGLFFFLSEPERETVALSVLTRWRRGRTTGLNQSEGGEL